MNFGVLYNITTSSYRNVMKRFNTYRMSEMIQLETKTKVVDILSESKTADLIDKFGKSDQIHDRLAKTIQRNLNCLGRENLTDLQGHLDENADMMSLFKGVWKQSLQEDSSYNPSSMMLTYGLAFFPIYTEAISQCELACDSFPFICNAKIEYVEREDEAPFPRRVGTRPLGHADSIAKLFEETPVRPYADLIKDPKVVERVTYLPLVRSFSESMVIQKRAPRLLESLLIDEVRSLDLNAKAKDLFKGTDDDVNPKHGNKCASGFKLLSLAKYQRFAQSLICPSTAPSPDGRSGIQGVLMWHSVGSGKTCSAKAVIGTFLWDFTEKEYNRFTWVTKNSLKEDTVLDTKDICGWRELTDTLQTNDPNNVLSKIMASKGKDWRNKEARESMFNRTRMGPEFVDSLLRGYMNLPRSASSDKHFGNGGRRNFLLGYGSLLKTLLDSFRSLSLSSVDPLAGMLFVIDEGHLIFDETSGLNASRTANTKTHPEGTHATSSAFKELAKLIASERRDPRHVSQVAGLLREVVIHPKGITGVYRLTAAIAFSNLVNPKNPVRVVILTATPANSNFREALHLMNLTRQFPHDPVALDSARMQPDGMYVLTLNRQNYKLGLNQLFSTCVSRAQGDMNPRLFPMKLAMNRCESNDAAIAGLKAKTYFPAYPKTGVRIIAPGIIGCPMSPYQQALYESPNCGKGGPKSESFLMQCRRVALTVAMGNRTPYNAPEVQLSPVAPSLEGIKRLLIEGEGSSELLTVNLEIQGRDGISQVRATESQVADIERIKEQGKAPMVRIVGGKIAEVGFRKLEGLLKVKDIQVNRFEDMRKDNPALYTPIKDLHSVAFPDLPHLFPHDPTVKPSKEVDKEERKAGPSVPQSSVDACKALFVKKPCLFEGPKEVPPIDKEKKISLDCRFDAKGYSPAKLCQVMPALKLGETTYGMTGLELVSGKFASMLNLIRHLDKVDLLKTGKLQKHVIYTDLAYSGYGVVRAIVGALLACPMKGYSGKGGGYFRPQVQGVARRDFVGERGKQPTLSEKVYSCQPKDSSDENPCVPGAYEFKQHQKCFAAPTVLVMCKSGIKDVMAKGSSDAFYLQSRQKKAIIDYFNAPDNANGEKARFLVLDKDFREGLSVYNTPYMHILDVPLTQAGLTQTMGRIARLCGSKGLHYDTKSGCGWQDKTYLYMSTTCREGWPCVEGPVNTLYQEIIGRMDMDMRQNNEEIERIQAQMADPKMGIVLDAELNAYLDRSTYGKGDMCPSKCPGSDKEQFALWETSKARIYNIRAASAPERRGEDGVQHLARPPRVIPQSSSDHSHVAPPRPSQPQLISGVPPLRPGASPAPTTIAIRDPPMGLGAAGIRRITNPPAPQPHIRPRRTLGKRRTGGPEPSAPPSIPKFKFTLPRQRSMSPDPAKRRHAPTRPFIVDDGDISQEEDSGSEDEWDSDGGSDIDSDVEEIPRRPLPPRQKHSRRARRNVNYIE